MFKRIIKIYRDSSLAEKIRTSYFIILVPMICLVLICLYSLWRVNSKYGSMVEAASVASEFSLDFKKDFDYETYLLIVENKTLEESELDRLLQEAGDIVTRLEESDSGAEGSSTIKSFRMYLTNLETYKKRIEENLKTGNKYEENILIWENDVQIVTSLLNDSMLRYIYVEIQNMRASRVEYNAMYMKIMVGVLAAVVVITAAFAVSSWFIPKSITKPITELSKVTNQVANGDLTVRADTDAGAEVGDLAESFNSMIDKISSLLDQVTLEQVHLRKAELELLQSQINPHFLYNTLDTIVWLAEGGDSKQVVDMVRNLSDFFRTSLNQGKDMVTLREELLHVGSYLRIQHVRYMDILEYDIKVPEELYTYIVPKITIQPLVENALYHGIKNKRGKGLISITGEALEDSYLIKVCDNGIGIEEEKLQKLNKSLLEPTSDKSGSFGLTNVNERLQLKFGSEYGIKLESAYGSGTTVTVKLPLYLG